MSLNDQICYQGKRLLIIGAGHEQVPAIILAKKLGIKVYSTDLDENSPGATLADVFGKISTDDAANNLIFAKNNSIDGVMTVCSELAVPVVAEIADKLGISTGMNQKVSQILTNKNKMHKAFNKFNVPCPNSSKISHYLDLKAFAEANDFPIVVKPSISSGQKGIKVVSFEKELKTAYENAKFFSKDDKVIAECFIDGPEINVTAAVRQRKIEFLSFSERITAGPSHFGIAIAHKAPINLGRKVYAEVKRICAKAIKSTGLVNGIAYPQLIVSPSHGVKVIEIAGRVPGGYMRDVALLQSGIDMIEIVIDQALGVQMPLEYYRRYKSYEAIYVKFLTKLDFPSVSKVRTIKGFSGKSTQNGLYLSECRLRSGDQVPTLTSSSARFGAIICHGESSFNVETKMETVLNKIIIE